jgi:transposase
MPSVSPKPTEIIVGVDTHKHQHVAFAIDGLGRAAAEPITIPATGAGYAQLLAWADALGTVHAFGVEGCGSYGIGLARFLRRHGRSLQEVARPVRRGERRKSGKSDAIDAEHAARTILTSTGTATPKLANGPVEALRLIKIARDTAVKAQSMTMITLKAMVVTAPSGLRERIEPLNNHQLVLACSALDSSEAVSDPEVAVRYALGALGRRWLQLHEEIKTHTAYLKELTRASAPELVDTFGVGFDSAAEFLIAAGDNADRIRSEAAFAKLCGACPIPAGSGMTNGRHRLNRGGNRQANASLYRIVIVRMRWHPATMAYVERRTAEGLSKKEIIRCLKRFVAREIYRLLPRPSSASLPKAA